MPLLQSIVQRIPFTEARASFKAGAVAQPAMPDAEAVPPTEPRSAQSGLSIAGSFGGASSAPIPSHGGSVDVRLLTGSCLPSATSTGSARDEFLSRLAAAEKHE